MRNFVALTVLFLVTSLGMAQDKSGSALQVHREDGGSVAVRTAGGFFNQDSSLKRTFYIVDDPSSPATIEHAGIFPRLDEKEKVQYFLPSGTVAPKQAVSAVEVRYILFDVWGQRLRTLAATRLADSSTHVDFRGSAKWMALESEFSQLVTVVSFVSRIRTAEGDVWVFDANRMASQIEALGLNVAPPDLNPDEQRVISPGLIYWTYSPKDGETVRAAGVWRP